MNLKYWRKGNRKFNPLTSQSRALILLLEVILITHASAEANPETDWWRQYYSNPGFGAKDSPFFKRKTGQDVSAIKPNYLTEWWLRPCLCTMKTKDLILCFPLSFWKFQGSLQEVFSEGCQVCGCTTGSCDFPRQASLAKWPWLNIRVGYCFFLCLASPLLHPQTMREKDTVLPWESQCLK